MNALALLSNVLSSSEVNMTGYESWWTPLAPAGGTLQ